MPVEIDTCVRKNGKFSHIYFIIYVCLWYTLVSCDGAIPSTRIFYGRKICGFNAQINVWSNSFRDVNLLNLFSWNWILFSRFILPSIVPLFLYTFLVLISQFSPTAACTCISYLSIHSFYFKLRKSRRNLSFCMCILLSCRIIMGMCPRKKREV